MDNSGLNSFFEHNYRVNKVVKENTLEEISSSIIKVIGVGGGGGNAVNYMFENKIKDVEFVITNTDRQVLLKSPIPTKIQLGASLTQGLGTGMDVSNGRNAALESIDDIKAVLGGSTKMVFITAGMGGGTGTGAAPVIAKAARDMGLLTVSVVTAPYSWEGTVKRKQAMEGIAELQENSDTVLVVLNDKLEELFEDLTLSKAFAEADNILMNAVKSISEIITTSGNINTDFRDVEKVLKDAKQSVMGTADADGKDRAQQAIVQALDSPLLNDRNIAGAKSIIVTLASSTKREATIREQSIITRYVTEQVQGEHGLFKLGTIIDESLGDRLRVTIVASGFERNDGGIPLPAAPVREEPVVTEIIINPTPSSIATEKVEVAPVANTFVKSEVSTEESKALELETTYTGGSAALIVEEEIEPETNIFFPNGSLFVASSGSLESASKEKVEANWPIEELSRISELVNLFEQGAIQWIELETPAFKRNNLSLWNHPNIPVSEFERHRLN